MIKLYKGTVTTVAQLLDSGPIPAQPTNPGNLPPTFMITSVRKSTWGKNYVINYYTAKTGKTYREVPENFELNVLSGTRGRDLKAEWSDACTKNLSKMARRISCSSGTDPEIFVVDKDGKVIPAWTYLPKKTKPLYFEYHNRPGTAYWDGFQAEFTVTPNSCLSWVVDNVQGGLKTIHQSAKKVGGKLSIETVLPVDPDFLQNEAIEHVQFGCAPSFNAYGLQGNGLDGRDVPYRFTGGHLHLGLYGDKSKPTVERYVKALDRIFAVASVSLLGELDNPIRRKFYGLPGEYRMPPHGLEYRVLSNAWLCHPLAMNFVFDMARSVCGLSDDGLDGGWQGTQDEAIEIVIENDIDRARAVLDRNKDMFREIVKMAGLAYVTHTDAAAEIWHKGIGSVIEDPKDVVKNWNLETTWTAHAESLGKNWGKAAVEYKAGRKL